MIKGWSQIHELSGYNNDKSLRDKVNFTSKIINIMIKRDCFCFISYLSFRNFILHCTNDYQISNPTNFEKQNRFSMRLSHNSKRFRTQKFQNEPLDAIDTIPTENMKKCNTKVNQLELKSTANDFFFPELVFTTEILNDVDQDVLKDTIIEYRNNYIFEFVIKLDRSHSFITMIKGKSPDDIVFLQLVPFKRPTHKKSFIFSRIDPYIVIMISIRCASVFMLKPSKKPFDILKKLSKMMLCSVVKLKDCIAYKPDLYEGLIHKLMKHENETISSSIILEYFSHQKSENEILLNRGSSVEFKNFINLLAYSTRENSRHKNSNITRQGSFIPNSHQVKSSNFFKSIAKKKPKPFRNSVQNFDYTEHRFDIIPRFLQEHLSDSIDESDAIFKLKRIVGNSFVNILFVSNSENINENQNNFPIDFDPHLFTSDVQSLFILVYESREKSSKYVIESRFSSDLLSTSKKVRDLFPSNLTCESSELFTILDKIVSNSNLLYRRTKDMTRTLMLHRKIILKRLYQKYVENISDKIKWDNCQTLKICGNDFSLLPGIFLIDFLIKVELKCQVIPSVLIISQIYVVIVPIDSTLESGFYTKSSCLKAYIRKPMNKLVFITKHGLMVEFIVKDAYNTMQKLMEILDNDLNLKLAQIIIKSDSSEIDRYLENRILCDNSTDYSEELSRSEIYIQVRNDNSYLLFPFNIEDICEHFVVSQSSSQLCCTKSKINDRMPFEIRLTLICKSIPMGIFVEFNTKSDYKQ